MFWRHTPADVRGCVIAETGIYVFVLSCKGGMHNSSSLQVFFALSFPLYFVEQEQKVFELRVLEHELSLSPKWYFSRGLKI